MITPVEIIQAAADHYGITTDEILSKRRFYLMTEARHVAMHVACELLLRADFPTTLTALAVIFNRREHSCIIHARDRIANEMENCPRIRVAVEHVRNIVLARESKRRAA